MRTRNIALWDHRTEDNISFLFQPLLPSLRETPVVEVAFNQVTFANNYVHCAFCLLNSKLALLFFVLLLSAYSAISSFHFSGPNVSNQCHVDDTHYKGDPKNHQDDRTDSFIQSCQSTEDKRNGRVSRQGESPLPQPTRRCVSLTLPAHGALSSP